ncbi:MAG: hypothetical protein WAZ98_10510 [Cyclobacteriaceae bacterium]
MLKRYPLWLLLLFFSFQVFSQVKISRKDSIRSEKIRQGKFLFSQVLLPASAPETGFLLGSASAFTFTLDKSDSALQRSSVPIIAYVSVRGAVGFSSDGNLFFKKKIRWLNSIEFNHIIDNYWGVGFDAGSTFEQSEDSTQYTKNNFRWNPKVLKEIRPKIFLGPQTDYSITMAKGVNSKMEEDPAYLQYGDCVSVFGIGALAQYDTRDFIVNSWKGTLVELSWLSYPASWSTGEGYSILSFDFRHFACLGKKPGKILALNFRTRMGFGDVPYTELPTIGSDNNLRAYYGGRYRDQNSLYAVAEYRHTFKRNVNLSKHGVVVWTGAGEIWSNQIALQNILPVLGVGYRFALQPRINLRVDVGVGRDSFGFYLNITEAF